MHDGKVVIITGANGGLGSAVTRVFLDSGAIVYGLAKDIQASAFTHPAFHAVMAEIHTAAHAAEAVSRITASSGRIDALVHLVGGFAGGQSVESTDEATASRMMDLNFHTAFHLLRAILPVMRSQRSGSIVAIGSRTAEEPQAMLGAYSASKAALVSLIRTVALEGKSDGITANAILPGTMDTPANRAANPQVDPSMWVQPAQIAALLLHLTSPSASQVTGAVIPVYGSGL